MSLLDRLDLDLEFARAFGQVDDPTIRVVADRKERTSVELKNNIRVDPVAFFHECFHRVAAAQWAEVLRDQVMLAVSNGPAELRLKILQAWKECVLPFFRSGTCSKEARTLLTVITAQVHASSPSFTPSLSHMFDSATGISQTIEAYRLAWSLVEACLRVVWNDRNLGWLQDPSSAEFRSTTAILIGIRTLMFTRFPGEELLTSVSPVAHLHQFLFPVRLLPDIVPVLKLVCSLLTAIKSETVKQYPAIGPEIVSYKSLFHFCINLTSSGTEATLRELLATQEPFVGYRSELDAMFSLLPRRIQHLQASHALLTEQVLEKKSAGIEQWLAGSETEVPLGFGSFGSLWKCRRSGLTRIVRVMTSATALQQKRVEKWSKLRATLTTQLLGVEHASNQLLLLVEPFGDSDRNLDKLALCEGVAAALVELHECCGCIHGNLTLSNCLVDAKSGGVKLTDPHFEWSTPKFPPPERMIDAEAVATDKHDIFALGLLVVHLFSQVDPGVLRTFYGDYVATYCATQWAKQRRASLSLPAQPNVTSPPVDLGHPKLTELVRSCLHVLPSHRPTAASCLSHLARYRRIT